MKKLTIDNRRSCVSLEQMDQVCSAYVAWKANTASYQEFVSVTR
jgi:hypothetical protein